MQGAQSLQFPGKFLAKPIFRRDNSLDTPVDAEVDAAAKIAISTSFSKRISSLEGSLLAFRKVTTALLTVHGL